MKVLLAGLAGAAAIVCALYFIFRAPEEPVIAEDAGPRKTTVQTAKMAEAPKSSAAASSAGVPKYRSYVSTTRQRFDFLDSGKVTMTSFRGNTLGGTYTKENDVILVSFAGGNTKTTMEFIETAHGMVGMTGGQVGLFFGTDDPEKIRATIWESSRDPGTHEEWKKELNILKKEVEALGDRLEKMKSGVREP